MVGYLLFQVPLARHVSENICLAIEIIAYQFLLGPIRPVSVISVQIPKETANREHNHYPSPEQVNPYRSNVREFPTKYVFEHDHVTILR